MAFVYVHSPILFRAINLSVPASVLWQRLQEKYEAYPRIEGKMYQKDFME